MVHLKSWLDTAGQSKLHWTFQILLFSSLFDTKESIFAKCVGWWCQVFASILWRGWKKCHCGIYSIGSRGRMLRFRRMSCHAIANVGRGWHFRVNHLEYCLAAKHTSIVIDIFEYSFEIPNQMDVVMLQRLNGSMADWFTTHLPTLAIKSIYTNFCISFLYLLDELICDDIRAYVCGFVLCFLTQY